MNEKILEKIPTENPEKIVKIIQPKTATAFLKKSQQLIDERGKEYNKAKGERSFDKLAKCFTAKTGIEITAAHVALLLQDLKDIRQFSQDRFHQDSVEDGVTYSALKAEELYKQYNK
jgi:hypothetical protein